VAQRLTDFARNVTSQNGEDGMLAELLNRVEINTGWCVELGAWDGKYLSNTWSLWHDRGWSAVLIEGDAKRATELARSTAALGRIEVIEAYAQARTDQSLDALFERSSMPRHFEVLSLDVDGDDYYLWDDLTVYRPQIVVVEFNASFPPEVEFVQETGQNIGSSALSLVQLGERKGYALAGQTAGNLFFVDASLTAKLGALETNLVTLCDRAQVPIVYSDFGGHHYVLRTGGWGYSGASLHGENLGAQVRHVAFDILRITRLRAGQAKHAVAARVPAAANAVKAVRKLTW
jgi:hypothetical protein